MLFLCFYCYWLSEGRVSLLVSHWMKSSFFSSITQKSSATNQKDTTMWFHLWNFWFLWAAQQINFASPSVIYQTQKKKHHIEQPLSYKQLQEPTRRKKCEKKDRERVLKFFRLFIKEVKLPLCSLSINET